MSRLLTPMPSPRGTNREGLFMRSPAFSVAHDAGVEWTRERRADALKDPGAVDLDERIAQTRQALEEHLADVIADRGDLNRALEFLNSYASALTDPGEDPVEAEDKGRRMGMDMRRGGPNRVATMLKGIKPPRRV